MSDKQLKAPKTCPECGDHTTNWCKTCECCRPCKALKNKKSNDNNNPKQYATAYKKYPAPMKAIYAIFDGTELLYIGESRVTPKRLDGHFNATTGNNTNFVDVPLEVRAKWDYKILWDGTDHSKQDRLLLEAVLIQSLRPKYNKQWQQED